MKKRKYPRMKTCRKCGKNLFLRHFTRVGRGRTLHNWFDVCKDCSLIKGK